jgi:Transposase DDE domain
MMLQHDITFARGLLTVQYTVTSAAVHRLATDLLLSHLALCDYGRTCPATTLLSVVFAACARLVSVFAAAVGLRRAPSPETVRKALLANLPDIGLLEWRCNRAVRASLPRLKGRRHHLAIDLTLLPYHGRPWRDGDELYRGQAKGGTTHFHAYATAYLIQRGQRVTLALSYVRQGEDLALVLKRLLRFARRAGARAGLLLLDRGFYAVSVIRYLQAARRPFLMPVPMKGRKADHPKGPGGTRVFGCWKAGGFASYRLHSSGKAKATVSICVHVRNRAGRRGQKGKERLVYAYWGWRPTNPRRVSELYRERFGIETSYRQMNQGRARTCTRNPAVRLFLVAVALLLRNVWVWLHWEALSAKRRGGRRLRLEALTLKALLLMLLEVAVARFGFPPGVRAERPIPERLRA